jgi:hypothetical protein
MRVTPRDANFTGPGSRFCILRPELITAFWQVNYDILILTLVWALILMFLLVYEYLLYWRRPKLQRDQNISLKEMLK